MIEPFGAALTETSDGPALTTGLLPERHPTADFFVCDIFDALPKGDLATMEHPMFSLATRPDRRILRYDHGPVTVEITPSVRGLATVHDKDVLIFCISQLMAALNAGQPLARRLELRAHDLLVATNRETSGDGYRRLRDAFERLAGTRITTNIATGDTETTEGFGLIEAWRIVRHTRAGRMVSVSVTLSDWLYRAVLAKSVLTLDRGYFRLRKPLERRLYEIARKHCGRQRTFRISLETLLKKSGSHSPRRVFRKMVRDIIAADHLPEYTFAEEPGDIIRVSRRSAAGAAAGAAARAAGGPGAPGLDPDMPRVPEATLERVRAFAPGWDVHGLLAEWQAWWAGSGRVRLRSPGAAFEAWARGRVRR